MNPLFNTTVRSFQTKPHWLAAVVLLLLALPVSTARAATSWGRLANPGVANDRIKATLFFAGQARDGSAPYGCAPAAWLDYYTVHPLDKRHQEWTSDPASRLSVLKQMASAGLNAIFMSSWGEDFLPCSTGWVPYAPMQTAPQAHDELFAAAANTRLLIVPFIESRGDWTMRAEFPTATDGSSAPGTVSQIVNLIARYLMNPSHPEWNSRWARVYDRTGEPRFAVTLIHAASDRLSATEHAAFAAGFDAVADEVFLQTGIRVGFFLDALPPDTFAPGVFRPTPEETGPYLGVAASILGIAGFIPEIWTGASDTDVLVSWKRDYGQRWRHAGIPFLADVSPGYDAHLIFGSSAAPPYGHTPRWRSELAAFVADLGGDGTIFNSWNGYMEAMVAVPSVEYGTTDHVWLQSLSPFAVPGRIEAELFEGADPFAPPYRDLTSANEGGQYRATPVDLEACLDMGGGYNVGWAKAGEYLTYIANVIEPGLYILEARVASAGPGGKFRVEFNGIDVTGSLNIPNTGGWQTWRTLTRNGIALRAGQYTVRLVMEADSAKTGFVGNFNYLELRRYR